MELVFVKERETKRTIRFAEKAEFEDDAAVGTLYVSKRALRELGNDNGEKPIKVTLSVAS